MIQGKFEIHGMSFHAFHGEMEVERELGQVFTVDVVCTYTPGLDLVNPDAVGFAWGADIYEGTKEVIMGTKYRSIDGLALAISKRLYRISNKIEATEVAISRKQLFIAGGVEKAVVTAKTTREELMG